MAHVDAGKTTLAERVLFFTGVNRSMGEVHDGQATMDSLPEEKTRGITIASAATTCFWRVEDGGESFRFTLIDTPGHMDFTGEVERSLRVLDGAIAVFDAVAGVQSQTLTVWRQADRHGVPRIAFVNKMDRPGANFAAAVESMRKRLGARPLALHLPIGAADTFVGVVDLVTMRALRWNDDDETHRPEIGDVPEELRFEALAARERLIEALADADDDIAHAFLAEEAISESRLHAAIRRATIAGRLVPVLCGSAYRNAGVQPVLDAVARYLPSPLDVAAPVGTHPETGDAETLDVSENAPFFGLVFKTETDRHAGSVAFVRVYSGTLEPGAVTLNAGRDRRERVSQVLAIHADRRESVDVARAGDIVALTGLKHAVTGDTLCDEGHALLLEAVHAPEPVVTVAVEPATRADLAKLSPALAKLAQCDPSLRLGTDPETGRPILGGMGELHLEVTLQRLTREYGVEVRVGQPCVAYRDTIRREATGHGRFKQQNGGSGMFGEVELVIRPLPRGGGFTFADKTVGGVIPKQFMKSIEQGVRDTMRAGLRDGVEVIDLAVEIIGGAYHVKDSNEPAFRAAGRLAFLDAAQRAGLQRLEPLAAFDVETPEEAFGLVLGDLSSRRARVEEIGQRGAAKFVLAVVPVAETFSYAGTLRSLTRGEGTFTAQPAGYAEVV